MAAPNSFRAPLPVSLVGVPLPPPLSSRSKDEELPLPLRLPASSDDVEPPMSWKDFEDYSVMPYFLADPLCRRHPVCVNVKWVDQPGGSGGEAELPKKVLQAPQSFPLSVVSSCKFFSSPYCVIGCPPDVLGTHSEIKSGVPPPTAATAQHRGSLVSRGKEKEKEKDRERRNTVATLDPSPRRKSIGNLSISPPPPSPSLLLSPTSSSTSVALPSSTSTPMSSDVILPSPRPISTSFSSTALANILTPAAPTPNPSPNPALAPAPVPAPAMSASSSSLSFPPPSSLSSSAPSSSSNPSLSLAPPSSSSFSLSSSSSLAPSTLPATEEVSVCAAPLDEQLLSPSTSYSLESVPMKGFAQSNTASSPRGKFGSLETLSPFEVAWRPKSLCVDCRNVVVELGASFEPYYCALYAAQLHFDTKKTTRLSASFYFDTNSNQVMTSILGDIWNTCDPINRIRKTILSLPDRNPDTILILKIAKALRSVENEKIYMKPIVAKPKDVERMKKETKELEPSEYMQAFAWAFVAPFDEEGGLSAKEFIVSELRPLKVPLTDDVIFETFEREIERKEKVKYIRGQVELCLSLHDDLSAFPAVVTPSLTFIGSKEVPVKEWVKQTIEWVPSPSPPLTYVNIMYLTPESVVLKHSSNILLEFQLRSSDRADASRINCFANPYSLTSLSETGFTWTSHKERKDQFFDDIEVQLPPNLDAKFHFLVTIYNVNQSPKKKEEKRVPFGYVAIPIFANNSVIPDSRYSFPIFLSPLPSEYLSALGDASLFHEGRKPLFTLRTKLISSTVTTDPVLAELFTAVQNEEKLRVSDPVQAKKALVSSLENLPSIDPLSAFVHLPFLLDTSLSLLSSSSTSLDVRRQVLTSLVTMLNGVRKSVYAANLNAFLRSYVWFWYCPFSRPSVASPGSVVSGNASDAQLYEHLAVTWNHLIEGEGSKGLLSGHESWFFLDLIVKSAVVYLFSEGKFQGTMGGSERRKWFSEEFYFAMESLMSHILAPNKMTGGHYTVHLASRLIQNLLLFTDRGRLFTWIRGYFKKMEPDDQHSVKVKFSILRSLVDDINFVPLNLPVSVPFKTVSMIQHQYWKVHYMCGQILYEVFNCLTDFKNPDINFTRKFAIDSFCIILQKLESHGSQKVWALFFPYVPLLAKNVLTLEPFTASQKYDWMFAFIRLLSHAPEEALNAYWTSETQRGLSLFCKALSMCMKIIFEHTHQKVRQMAVPNDIKYSDVTNMKDLKLMRQKANREADTAGEVDVVIQNTFSVICWICGRFLQTFEKEMSGEECHLIQMIFGVVHDLAQIPAVDFLSVCGYFPLLKRLIVKFGESLFNTQNDVIILLTHDLLRLCNSPSERVRSKATSLFLLLLECSYSQSGEYEKMSVLLSVALSELHGKPSVFLSSSVLSVKEFSAKKMLGEEEKKREGFGRLLTKMSALLQYNQTILEVSSIDPELTADLYEKISLSYLEAPDTRVQWLENLAVYHISHKNYVEAALCKIHHAELVRDYFHRYSSVETERKLPVYAHHFTALSPSLEKEPPLPTLREGKIESQFQLSTWSIQGMEEMLTSAVEWLKEATWFEGCLEIYSVLEIIYKYTRNYEALMKVLEGYRETVSLLLTDTPRLLPKYFRASFFGKRVGEMEGRGFVYRVGPATSLHSFTAQIKNSLKHRVKSQDDFVVLPNKPFSAEGLEEDKIYLQIGGITVFSKDTSTSSECTIAQNVDTFLFEMSHQKTQKKKIIYTVERTFPYIKSRLEICKTDELILSPIEAAIENVTDRVKAIRVELSAPVPRINTLQQILQGSVVPMVNEGPLKICADFLSPEVVDQYDPKNVAALKDALREFIRNCGFALRLNARLIDEKHKPFQDMCNQKYEELSKMIKKYID